MTEPPDSTWSEERAVAFALGRLEEAEEGRFRVTVAGGFEFDDLLEERDADAGDHVPAALLARWRAAEGKLGELERRLVAEHLDGCASCREELQVLDLGTVSVPLPAPVSRGASWWPWFGGVVLGVAATLAVMTVRVHERSDFHGQEIQVVTPRAMRGPDAAMIRLGPGERTLLLAVGLPVDVDPGAPATLLVYDPESDLFSETRLGPASWASVSVQILLTRAQGFVAGEYRVELRVDGESGAHDLGRFVIERAR